MKETVINNVSYSRIYNFWLMFWLENKYLHMIKHVFNQTTKFSVSVCPLNQSTKVENSIIGTNQTRGRDSTFWCSFNFFLCQFDSRVRPGPAFLTKHPNLEAINNIFHVFSMLLIVLLNILFRIVHA